MISGTRLGTEFRAQGHTLRFLPIEVRAQSVYIAVNTLADTFKLPAAADQGGDDIDPVAPEFMAPVELDRRAHDAAVIQRFSGRQFCTDQRVHTIHRSAHYIQGQRTRTGLRHTREQAQAV